MVSPQSTLKAAMVPSGSEALKVIVTVSVMFTGFGETLVTVTMGGRSFTVSNTVFEPGPTLLVAVTATAKL
jgi:hypothetical protein